MVLIEEFLRACNENLVGGLKDAAFCDSTIQLNRGFAASTLSGFIRYSHRSVVGLICAVDRFREPMDAMRVTRMKVVAFM